MKNKKILPLVFIALTSQAQTTIGWDASCQYDMNDDSNAVQQAIDDGHTDIRLTNENPFFVNLDIGNAIDIRGAYDSCNDAISGVQSDTNTVLDGSQAAQAVIKLSFFEEADMVFSHLTIENGTGMSSGNQLNYSGGIAIRSIKGTLLLIHSIIQNNNGYQGGGMVVFGETSENPNPLIINFIDTLIQNNTASFKGGGLFCRQLDNSVKIIMNLSQGSSIRYNHSDDKAGGIINNRCEINFQAGTSTQTLDNPHLELYQNSANKSGAGIWSQAGVTSFIGSNTEPFNITQNHASIGGNSDGGGVFMTSSGQAILTNTYVSSNTTKRYGAGLFASFGGEIVMASANSGCIYSAYCSKLNSNRIENTITSGRGAVASVRLSGKIDIKTSLITNNNSGNSAYLAYVDDDGELLIEGNLILNNGNDLNDSNFTGFVLKNGGKVTAAYNTFEGNTKTLFKDDVNAILELFGNIINHTSIILSNQPSSTETIICNMINDVSTIAVTLSETVVGTADYIDTENNDYRLAQNSIQAMDVCNGSLYLPSRDLAQKFRGLDNADVLDVNGLFDLGAYEYDDGNLIFINSFE
jgi:hypothetical protein